MKIEERIKELGLELPEVSAPLANYVPVVVVDSMLFTAGAICLVDGKLRYEGKVGSDITLEEGREASRITLLNLLASIKAEIGDLDKIERVVKLVGLVNCKSDFYKQPAVINGASDLLVEIFGDRGRHARSAVGASSLPMNTPVEIDMIVKVKV